ncbi:MAG: zinc-dependent alcohol dehydrogenase family protein [Planctomycetia bacterium]|nr:zinc-dependent alcohol dehydrogenase family protein [Planctomycetia bacterium]
MKALIYRRNGEIGFGERPRPSLQSATDAIVRLTKTTICGTDLHIIKGDVPTVSEGRILGHEGIGVVENIGTGVSTVSVGDRVLVSCITSCGRCSNCKRGMYSHCSDGGWLLGNRIDGTQAEFVRIPHADGSLHRVPDGCDEEAVVMLSDILPTSYECGVLNGRVQPGDSVVIVGGGPIGLATLLTAQFYSPATIVVVDVDDNRLEVARRLGASATVNGGDAAAVEKIMSLTDGVGFDVVVEAVGIPASFDLCQTIVAAGGRIANIGVHGKPVQLNLDKLWSQNITLTTRLVDTVTTPLLLKTITTGKLRPQQLITHRYALNDIVKAYETFGNAKTTHALKVIVSNE